MLAGDWKPTEDGELLWLPDDPTSNVTARLMWVCSTQSVMIVWSRGLSLEILHDGVQRLTATETARDVQIAQDAAAELRTHREAEVGIFAEDEPPPWEPPTEAEMDAEFEREREEGIF